MSININVCYLQVYVELNGKVRDAVISLVCYSGYSIWL